MPQPLRYRAVLFDLDGTLVDSYNALTEAVNYARRQYGLDELSAARIRNLVGDGVGRAFITEYAQPTRADGRLFYADLEQGVIKEFQLPQFANGVLPDGLTVHGFGEDANGELYALVTNTPASGTGGIVYQLVAVPEPTTFAGVALLAGIALLRRRRS